MIENKHSNRRRLLFGITIGASQLPVKWTKPVINSIILPAHAMCSSRVDLRIPGRAFDCGSATETISFEIIDSDICAPTFTTGTSNIEAANRIILFNESATDSQRVFVNGPAGEVIQSVLSTPGSVCPGTVINAGGAFSLEVQGSSGALFRATGTITAAGTGTTVTAIQLTPI